MKDIFVPGKLTFIMDGGAGSSGKGSIGAFLWSKFRSKHTTFTVNTFMSNAAHTVIGDDGVEHVYQALSCVTHTGEYSKQFLAPGCVQELDALLGEIKKYNVTPFKLGIDPMVAIVQPKDIDYEKGTHDFDGNAKLKQDSANLRLGSTLQGVGAARARRMLRRDDVVLAKDIVELRPFLCDTAKEISARLDEGESGMCEIAQGYQLSLFTKFYPKTTSRNCTVAAALDDCMLPPKYAGNVVINFRTLPIRVNSNKYLSADGKVLTYAEYEALPEGERTIVKGDSGGCYDDQEELSWEQVSEMAGAPIREVTTLTKLPRRVFSFSRKNLIDAIKANDTGHNIFISVNFVNYIDASVAGIRTPDKLSQQTSGWLGENVVSPIMNRLNASTSTRVAALVLGTGKLTDDRVVVEMRYN
jgi:adenylosuccinate synthase